MAHIITSNKVLADTTNALYITDKGFATKNVKDYNAEMLANGFDIPQLHFDALNTFENSIKPITAKIVEIYPFMGTTIDNQLTKLKHKNTIKGVAINGIDATFVDAGKGLKWDTYLSGGAKAIDTGLKDADLASGFGFVVYGDFPAYADYRGLFGKGADLVLTDTDFFFLNAQNELANSNNATAFAATGSVAGSGILGNQITVSGGNIINRKLYKNSNVLLDEMVSIVHNTDANNYAIASLYSGVVSNYGFYGKIRFGAVTNGNLTNSEYLLLVDAINTLMTSLGKSF